MGWHRLIAGSHAVGSGETYRRFNASKDEAVVVWDDTDLTARFPGKFEYWRGEVTPVMEASKAPSAKAVKAPAGEPAYKTAGDAADLRDLTVAELRDVAADEEVELGAHMRKDEIVAAIEEARGGKVTP